MKRVIQTSEQLLNLRGSKGEGTNTIAPSHSGQQETKPCCSCSEQKTLPGQVAEEGDRELMPAGHKLDILQNISVSQLFSFRAQVKFLAKREEGRMSPGRLRNQSLPGHTSPLTLMIWLLPAQERDQTEGPCSVPHHVYLVEFKHPLTSFIPKCQSGPKIFPNESIIKKKSQLLSFGMLFFRLKEASHTVSIIMNLLAWKKTKYQSTCSHLSTACSVRASGDENTSTFAWKGF